MTINECREYVNNYEKVKRILDGYNKLYKEYAEVKEQYDLYNEVCNENNYIYEIVGDVQVTIYNKTDGGKVFVKNIDIKAKDINVGGILADKVWYLYNKLENYMRENGLKEED